MALAYRFSEDISPAPHTRLPAINRSPSPSFVDSMRDLVPAPLRKRSPSPAMMTRESHEQARALPAPAVGSRAGVDYPYRRSEEAPSSLSYAQRRPEETRSARSVSPLPRNPPLNPPPHIRARTPPRIPNGYTPEPAQTAPARSMQNLSGSPDRRPYPNSDRTLPSSTRIEESMRHVRVPQSQGVPGPRSLEPASSNRSMDKVVASHRLKAPKTVEPLGPNPRKHVPSMVDYLSLEQLENLWESQDLYKGTVDVPLKSQKPLPPKPASPLWRIDETDPRSPVHPAFRAEPFSIQREFTSPVFDENKQLY